jgi:hypothetical protein
MNTLFAGSRFLDTWQMPKNGEEDILGLKVKIFLTLNFQAR